MSEINPTTAVTISQQNSQVDLVLNAVIRAASDPGVDVAKMRELMALQKELMAMDAEGQFNRAYQQLQQDLPKIKKDGSVEYANKKTGEMDKAFDFATWEGIDDVIRPILHRHGFSLSFDSVPRPGDGGGVIVTGTLRHVAGHKSTAGIPVPLDTSGGKNANQGYGSALSYGKRYTTTALLNLVFEGDDDDAQKAGIRFISPEQAEQIEALLKETGSDRNAFLRHFDVADVANLQAGDAVPAINMLNQKKARAKK